MEIGNAKTDAIIVGGGLAGLCCALALHRSGIEFRLLEAADRVGGRVRTDNVDGFRLDCGFQVFLTAYPEAKRVLDYDALDLQPFQPGALIRYRGRFHRFADPWRDPRHLLTTALSPVATLGDKLRVAKLRRRTCKMSLEEIFAQPDTSTMDHLRSLGFSPTIIERFFRPFLSGVFLESPLRTSSRFFEFVFRMFSLGEAAVPADGMEAIPRQLAGQLPPESVVTGVRVDAVRPNHVVLDDGSELPAAAIVVATEQHVAARLLNQPSERSWNGVRCFYFVAERPPLRDSILVLNGDGRGPINNLCVASNVAPTYAPDGRALISVSVIDMDRETDAVQAEVGEQLAEWFGDEARQWQLLASYEIPYALPRQDAAEPAAELETPDRSIFVCGDHAATSSIQGAMLSGRTAAEAVVRYLSSVSPKSP